MKIEMMMSNRTWWSGDADETDGNGMGNGMGKRRRGIELRLVDKLSPFNFLILMRGMAQVTNRNCYVAAHRQLR